MKATIFLALALLQQPAAPPPEVAVAPIECWWKTDRSAVHVGERFELTLTCAVLDTDTVKVVVDESSLAASVLHLVPFDVVSGQRSRDIENSPRRFFQYQYSIRLLGEGFFGKEVSLPALQVSYRVQNAMSGTSALSGRELQYSLQPVPIRALSLVPNGTVDIRDTPRDTFAEVDARLLRANLLFIFAGVALVLAVLLLVVALARATAKRRAIASSRKPVASTALVLRAASRELSSVHTASQQEGWSSELAGRAAAALRLAGAIALGKQVSQRDIDRDTKASEGQVTVARGMLGRKMTLSAAVTPGTAVRAEGLTSTDRAAWQGISSALAVFGAVRYSRNGNPDGVALDAALAEGRDLVKRLARHRLLRFGRSTPSSSRQDAAKQTWAR